ncbi:MAG: hypothetical protein FD187_926 [bacterium]|nr:MAG: hypothetical protein FD142_57 [bacterium]KAF0149632.1 MAG: hypothetical protein FD187_926 [bacterium]KAF0169298.1 MAG: hypothetical protein FD158_488 [bacterium]TXT16349.1 MAG: hypothetical protein FD132_2870 [bacterium]
MNSDPRACGLLFLALCAGLASAADPAPVFSGGADLRLRQEMFDNAIWLDSTNDDHKRSFQRYRARAWGQAAPAENIKAHGRLMWEGRHYSTLDLPATTPHDDTYNGALMFDSLYLQADRLGGLPLSLKLGRQDIILGNGWLVLDGTPFDGSRTIYFDALRATYSRGDTSLDLILVDNDAKSTLVLNNKDEDQIEQDEQGLILYARHKWNPDTSIDGFYMYKDNDASRGEAPPRWYNNGAAARSFADDGHTHAVGGRVESRFAERWSLRAEAAYQWGRRETRNASGGTISDRDLRAWGFNGRLTRDFGGDWKQRAHLGYEFLSGDDPDTSDNEAFDPLWGRWPQWSELIIYTYAAESRIGEITNLHRLNLGWTAQVHAKANLSLDWHALFADEKTCTVGALDYGCDGSFRGHLFTSWIRAKFDKTISGHLVAEYFLPGDYYASSNDDNAWFFRAEVNLTW